MAPPLLCCVQCHWHVFTALQPSNRCIENTALLDCCIFIHWQRHMLTVPLPSNGCIYSFHYSGFQLSCHNTFAQYFIMTFWLISFHILLKSESGSYTTEMNSNVMVLKYWQNLYLPSFWVTSSSFLVWAWYWTIPFLWTKDYTLQNQLKLTAHKFSWFLYHIQDITFLAKLDMLIINKSVTNLVHAQIFL
jgi:hypothetical protein